MEHDLIADLIQESILFKRIALLSLALSGLNLFTILFIFHQAVK